MSENQQMLMMISAVVAAFFIAGGGALCRGRPEPMPSWEDSPEHQEMMAEVARMKAEREARLNPKEPEAKRVPGAYYPEDLGEADEGGIDPLILAAVGGGLVFGLVGAGAFLMMGGLGSRDEKEPVSEEPPADV
ncbi:MAG: hypothetical protein H6737_00065 [Alphaproteobacteria bacterium]|nr:hypothetical protein [Alphaproteobacteria bacterium]